MESIVSPWFVYLVSIVDSTRGLIIAIAIVTVLMSAVYCVGRMVNRGEADDRATKEWNTAWGKVGKAVMVFAIVTIPLAVFMPNKNTLIAMYVANEVTYERLGKAGDITREIKDELKGDVMDILNLFIENKDIKTKAQQDKEGGVIMQ